MTPPSNPPMASGGQSDDFCTHHSCDDFRRKKELLKLGSSCLCRSLWTRQCWTAEMYTHYFTNVVRRLQSRHKSHRSVAISSSSGTCGRSSSSACGAGPCRAWDDDCLNSEHAAVPTRWAALSRPRNVFKHNTTNCYLSIWHLSDKWGLSGFHFRSP